MGITIIEKALMLSQKSILSYLGAQFLSMGDVKDMSKNLADKVALSYNPDLIVGINRGGYYPAYCLAEKMQLPYTLINISREKTYIGNIETDQILFLPKLLKKSQKIPKIKKPFLYKGDVKKVLIIDDDCVSMQTLDMARLHLEENDLESKTSVILSMPGATPDFFSEIQQPLSKFIQGKKRFPWTQYSPYFKDYQLWIQGNL